MNSSFITSPGKGIQDIRGGKCHRRAHRQPDGQTDRDAYSKNHNLYALNIHVGVYIITKEDRTKASTFITRRIKILEKKMCM